MRTRDGYDFDKDKCDRCGTTKAALRKKYAYQATSLDQTERAKASFSLHTDGTVLCSDCQHEYELEQLFAAMDARDKRKNRKTK